MNSKSTLNYLCSLSSSKKEDMYLNDSYKILYFLISFLENMINKLTKSKWSTIDCQQCKFVIFWVSCHKLLNDQRCHHNKTVFSRFTMINWLFFSSIHFIKESIFFNKSNEMSLNFLLHFCLTLFDRIFMLFLNVFIVFKQFSNLLRSFTL
jgi:hypothetical protein